MRVPDGAVEVATTVESEYEVFGMWRGPDGTLYVAGYHCGPSGDVLFAVSPDGSVRDRDALEAAE
jgi:hypothetical protein